jgi:hypothetical protein
VCGVCDHLDQRRPSGELSDCEREDQSIHEWTKAPWISITGGDYHARKSRSLAACCGLRAAGVTRVSAMGPRRSSTREISPVSRAARPNRLSRVLFQGADRPGRKRGAADYIVRGKMIGGFGPAAWPAHYGDSGVVTFIVDHDGIVHQKNLWPETAALAGAITRYDPDFQLAKGEALTGGNRQAGEGGTRPASTAPPGQAPPACPCPGWTTIGRRHIGLST